MRTSTLEKQFDSIWQRRHLVGGPEWVAELPDPKREYRFDPSRRWRFDFAWPAYRVAVEIDGGIYAGCKSHTHGPDIAKDQEKRNAAVELGWRVLVFNSRDLTGKRIITTIQQVANLLHKGKVVEIDEQLDLFK